MGVSKIFTDKDSCFGIEVFINNIGNITVESNTEFGGSLVSIDKETAFELALEILSLCGEYVVQDKNDTLF